MNETKPIKSAKFVASYGQNESVTITYEDNSVCSVPFDNIIQITRTTSLGLPLEIRQKPPTKLNN